MNETKKCSRCQELKPYSDFNKCKTGLFGLHNHCRECQKVVRREWYLKNKESELNKSVQYSKSQIGIEKRKSRYIKNKDKILEGNRVRRRTPYARKLANAARNKRYKESPSFRISVNMRSRIRAALKSFRYNNTTEKFGSTYDLLGCTAEELKTHLESLFKPGMTWENYGYEGWHIDHIIPCNSFDLTDITQQKICFHYTNLQPLWKLDNMSKGSKVLDEVKF